MNLRYTTLPNTTAFSASRKLFSAPLLSVGLFLLLAAALTPRGGQAQTYNMPTGNGNPINTCSGTFYDDGGAAGNYATNTNNAVQTFCPSNPGDALQFDFVSFNTADANDELEIFDGNSTAAPLIGSYNQAQSPGVVTSSNAQGCLTFRWNADKTGNAAGWEADIACVCGVSTPVIQNVDPLLGLTTCQNNPVVFTAVMGPNPGTEIRVYDVDPTTNPTANPISTQTTGPPYVVTGPVISTADTIYVTAANATCEGVVPLVQQVRLSTEVIIGATPPELCDTVGVFQLESEVRTLNTLFHRSCGDLAADVGQWAFLSGNPNNLTGAGQCNNRCGSQSGNDAMWSGNLGSNANNPNSWRRMETQCFDLEDCTQLNMNFCINLGNGNTPSQPDCEQVDLQGEEVCFQYSSDCGNTWNSIQCWLPSNATGCSNSANCNAPACQCLGQPVGQWLCYPNVNIPAAAIGPQTAFRWVQFGNSGTCCDKWSIDDITITGMCGGGQAICTPTYQWSPTTGLSNPTDPNPTATLQTTNAVIQQTYTLDVTCNNCTVSIDTTVTLTPPPDAEFPVPADECRNTDVTFEKVLGLVTGATYTWDFGPNATPQTANGPGPHTVQFSAAGDQTIELCVDAPSCPVFCNTETFRVKPTPVADLEFSDGFACAEQQTADTVTFTGTLGDPQHVFTWNCDGCAVPPTGQGPHELRWDTDGVKTVTVDLSSDGCPADQPAQVLVTVDPVPVPGFSITNQQVCDSLVNSNQITTQFSFNGTLGSPPHTYSWLCSNCIGLTDPTSPTPPPVSWATEGVKNIQLTVTSAGCTADSIQTVTVNRTPTSTFTTSQPRVCQNTNQGPFNMTLSFTGNAGNGLGATGANYTWNCDGCNPNDPLTTAGPHVVDWATTGTKTITVTAENTPSGCVSAPVVQTIIVDSVPPAPTVVDTSRCGPGEVLLDVNCAFGDVTRWYTGVATSPPFFDANDTLITNLTQTTTYWVSCFNSQTGCEGVRNPIVGTINPLPGFPSAPPVDSCGPSMIEFTAQPGIPPGDVLNLYDGDPADNATNLLSTANTNNPPNILSVGSIVQTTTTYVLESVISATGCRRNTTVLATINPIPGIPRSRDEARCDPGVVTFFVAMGTPAGTQVNLYPDAFTLTPIDVDLTSPFSLETPHLTANDSFWVRASDWQTGCISDPIKVRATVNPNPQPPTVADIERCGSGSSILTVTGVPANAEVRLFTQPSGDSPIAAQSNQGSYEFVLPTVSQTTTYYLQNAILATECFSPRVPVVVTVHPVPNAPSAADINRCGPGAVTLTAHVEGAVKADEIRLWDSPTAFNPIDRDSTYNYNLTTGTLSQTNTFYISGIIRASGCESDRVPVVVRIDPEAVPPVTRDVERCGPGAVALEATMPTPAGSEMRLYTQPMGGTPVSTDAVAPYGFNVDAQQTGTRYISVLRGACESDRVPVNITIHPIPEPAMSGDAERCGAGVFTFTAMPGNGGNEVRLYETNGGGNPIATDDTPPYELETGYLNRTTQLFVATKNSLTGCESIRIPVRARINPIPGPAQVSNTSRCDVGPVTIVANMGAPAGSQITLYSDMASSSVIASDDVGPSYELVVPVVNTTTTYFVETSDPQTGCIGPRVPTIVTVNPIPGPAVPEADNLFVCGSGEVTFTARMGTPPGNQIRLFTVQTGGTPVVVDNSLPYLLPTPRISNNSILYLESRNTETGCVSTRVPVRVTVITPPDAPTVANVERCGDGSVVFTPIMGPVSGAMVHLYADDNTYQILDSDSSMGYTLTTPVMNTTTEYLVAVEDDRGCVSERRKVVARINPIPGVPIIENNSRCGEGPVVVKAEIGYPQGNQIRIYDNPTGGVPVAADEHAPYELTLTYMTTSDMKYVSVANLQTGCESPRKPVLVEVNPVPAPPQTQDVSRCGPGPIKFSGKMVDPIGNVMRLYTQSLGGAAVAEDQSSQTTDFEMRIPMLEQTQDFWMQSVNTITGCVSERVRVSGVVHPLPELPYSEDVSRCGQGDVLFTVGMGQNLGNEAHLYDRQVGGTPLNSDRIPPFEVEARNVSRTTTFWVAGRNTVSGCESPRRPVVAHIHEIPSMPAVRPIHLCGPGQATLLATPGTPGGNEMRLFSDVTGGAALYSDMSQPYELMTPGIGTDTQFYVESRNTETGCASPRKEVTVMVYELPGTPVVADVSRCGEGEVVFTATMTGKSGTEVRLYDNSAGVNPVSVDVTPQYELMTPSLPRTQMMYVSSYDQTTGCESDLRPVQAIVHPIPAQPVVDPIELCGDVRARFTAQMGSPAGNQIRLYSQSQGGAALAADASEPYEIEVPQDVNTTTVFYLTSMNSATGCESTRKPVEVRVRPIPQRPFAEDEKICGDGTVTFYVSSTSVDGDRVQLYDAAGNTVLDTDSGDPYELTTGRMNAPADINNAEHRYYIATVAGDNCRSELVPVSAFVYPRPGTPVVNASERCGPGRVEIQVEAGQPGGNILKMYPDVVTSNALEVVDRPPYRVWTPPIQTSATYFLTMYDDQTGCESDRLPVEAKVHTVPARPIVEDIERCGAGQATFSAIMGTPGGTEIVLYNAGVGGSEIASDASQPYTLSTSTVQTNTDYYLTSRDRFTGCESPRIRATVLVHAQPLRPSVDETARCGAGVLTFTVQMADATANTIRLFTQAVGGSAISSDNNYEYTVTTQAINATTAFYIDAWNSQTQCASSRIQVQAIVNEVPDIPAAADVSICGTGTATFNAIMGSPAGDELRLYRDRVGGTPIDFDNSDPYTVTTDAVSQTTTFYLAGANPLTGCESRRNAVVASVNLLPGMPPEEIASRCGSGMVTFSANLGTPVGDVLRLYDGPIQANLIDENNRPPYTLTTPALTTNTTYYATVFNSQTGCESQPQTFKAVISDIPGVPMIDDVSRCAPGALTFSPSMTEPRGTELRLYSTATGGSIIDSDQADPFRLRTPALSSSRAYFVATYNRVTGCESPRILTNAIIHSIPGNPLVADLRRCGAGDVAIPVTLGTPSASQVRLYDQLTGGTMLDEAFSPNLILSLDDVSNTATYYVESYDELTGCGSKREPVVVTIDNKPGIPRALAKPRCGIGEVTITVTMGSPAGRMIQLFENLDGGVPISTAFTAPYEVITPTINTTTTYYVASIDNQTGCSSDRLEVTAQLRPQPTAPLVDDVTRCSEGRVVFTARMTDSNANMVRMYTATNSATPMATDNTGPYLLQTDNLTATTSYYFTVFNTGTGCESERVEAVALVSPNPADPNVSSASRCGPGALTLTVQMGTPSGNEARLYESPLSNQILSQDNNPPYELTTPQLQSSGVVYVEAVNAVTGCASGRVPVKVSVFDVPGQPNVINQERCGAGPVVYTAYSGSPNGTRAHIYDQLTGGTALDIAVSEPFELTINNVTNTSTYYIEILNENTGCVSPRREVWATVNPLPGKPVASDVTRCGGGIVVITATQGTPPGTEIRMFDALTGGSAIATDATAPYELETPFLNNQTAVYLGSVDTRTGCQSIRTPVNIEVYPQPQKPAQVFAERCGTGVVTFSLTTPASFGEEMRLYDQPIGGTSVSSAGPGVNVLQTPQLEMTRTYFLARMNTSTACESERVPVTATVNPLPGPPLSEDVERCGPGTVTLSAVMGTPPGQEIVIYTQPVGGTPVATRASSPYTWVSYPLQLSTKFYIESVRGNCASSRTPVQASILPQPNTPVAVNDGPKCLGELITLRAEGPDQATYYWTGPDGYSSEGKVVSQVLSSDRNTGEYRVRAVMGNCSSDEGVTRVEAKAVLPTPVATFYNKNREALPVCEGDPFNLAILNFDDFPANAGFEWVGPSFFQTTDRHSQPAFASATSAMEGTYNVRAFAEGCTTQATGVTVTVRPLPPTPEISTNAPVCAGDDIQLNLLGNPIPGATYHWSGPNGFRGSGTSVQVPAVPEQVGQYTLRVMSADGCISPDAARTTVRIKSNPNPPLVSSNGPVCEYETLSLTADGPAGATYVWSGPNDFTLTTDQQTQEVSNIRVDQSGVYSAYVIVDGCTSETISTEVVISPAPQQPSILTGIPDEYCEGEQVELSVEDQGGDIRYLWSGPEAYTHTGQSITLTDVQQSQEGVYSVVAELNGCRSKAGLKAITVYPLPQPSPIYSNDPVCVGDDLRLSVDYQAGVEYAWSGPNGFVGNNREMVISDVTEARSGEYSVVMENPKCSSVVSTRMITVRPTPPQPVAENSGPICAGQNLWLSASGVQQARYYWRHANGFETINDEVVLPAVSEAQGGSYEVAAIVEGCTSNYATTTVTIRPRPEAPVAGGTDLVCSGQDAMLRANAGQPARYYWTGPQGFMRETSMTETVIRGVNPRQSGVYSVVAIIEGCTSAVSTVTLEVSPMPNPPQVSNDSPVCQGGRVQLEASGPLGAQYVWQGPAGWTAAGTSPQFVANSLQTNGTYSARVIVDGCTSAWSNTRVQVIPRPDVPFVPEVAPQCVGQNLVLEADGAPNAQLLWDGPNSFRANGARVSRRLTSELDGGVYSVVAVNGQCTSDVASVDVSVNEVPPTPNVFSNGPVCAGQTLSLEATFIDGVDYAWSGPNGFTSNEMQIRRSNITTAQGGTYQLVVSKGICAAVPVSMDVQVLSQPPNPVASVSGTVCQGGTLQLQATRIPDARYYWTGPNSFFSRQQNPVISDAQLEEGGRYEVVATLGQCSSEVSAITVDVLPTPDVPQVNGPLVVCEGDNIELSATSNPTAKYTWTGPNNYTSNVQNPIRTNVSPNDAGQYSVRAELGSCDSDPAFIEVTVKPRPVTPNVSNNGPLCAGNALQLTANTVSGGRYYWTGPGAFVSELQNPVIQHAGTDHAGEYSLSVMVNGCASPAAITRVTVRPAPQDLTAENNGPLCAGEDALLSVSQVNGATYLWEGPNRYRSIRRTPELGNAQEDVSGTYTVTVSMGNCTATATTTLQVTAQPPRPQISSNSPLCRGDVLQLSASLHPNAAYFWTGPEGFTSSEQNPTVSSGVADGTYTMYTVMGNCTSEVVSTEVEILEVPENVVIVGDQMVCSGATVQMDATLIPGADYLWTGPAGFRSTQINPVLQNVQPGQAGVYSLSVRNGNCSAPMMTTRLTVTPQPQVQSTGNNSPLCTGKRLRLTATAAPGASYSWTGPNGFSSQEQNPELFPLTEAQAGTYTVTVTRNGCTSAPATTEVFVNPAPGRPEASGTGQVCQGDNIALEVPPMNGVSYLWSGPNRFQSTSRTPVISNAAVSDGGAYDVIAIANGCTSSAGVFNVTVVPTPVISDAGSNAPVCTGERLQLTATLIPGAEYVWTGPNGFTATGYDPEIPSAHTDDAGVYFVRAVVEGCTSDVRTVTVVVRRGPQGVTASNNGPACTGDDIALSTPDIPNGRYFWTGPGGYTSSQRTPQLSGVRSSHAGVYSVQVVAGGCTSQVAVTDVLVREGPETIDAGYNGPLCEGDVLNLTATSFPGAAYRWIGPNGYTSREQNPSRFNVSQRESGTYSVSAVANGCTSQVAGVQVVVNSTPPAIVAGNSGPVCEQDGASLSATSVAGATYEWTGPNGFTSTDVSPFIPVVNMDHAGQYTVRVTLGNCISDPATTMLRVHSRPQGIEAWNNGPICKGTTAELYASEVNNAVYTWTGPDGFSSNEQNPKITNIGTVQGGTYSVVVEVGGCTSPMASTTLDVQDATILASAGNNGPVCAGDALQLTAPTIPNAQYIWTGPDGFTSTTQNPRVESAEDSQDGAYSLTVVVGSCTSQTVITRAVVKPRPLAPEVTNNSPICVGESLRLTAIGLNEAQFVWSGPNGYTSDQPNPVIQTTTGQHDGTYQVYIEKDGCQSRSVSTQAVVHAPEAQFLSSNQSLCPGSTATVSVGFTGNGPWRLVYRENGVERSVESSAPAWSFNLTPNFTTDFELVSVTDNNGCTSALDAQQSVFVEELPDASVPTRLTACPGSEVMLPVDVSSVDASTAWTLTYTIDDQLFTSTGVGPGTEMLQIPLPASRVELVSMTHDQATCNRTFNGMGTFTDISTTPPAEIEQLNANRNTVAVTWSEVPGATGYTLRYRDANNPAAPWTEVDNLTDTQYLVPALDAGVTYEFSVRTHCGNGGASNWSPASSVQTLDACPQPTQVRVLNATTSSALVSWTNPAQGPVCHIVSYGPVNAPQADWQTNLVPQPGLTLTLTNLQADTEYGVRVRANCTVCAVNGNFLSPWSATTTFTTDANARAQADETGDVADDIQVYPNPNQGRFTVSFNAAQSAEASIKVTDITGRGVLTRHVAIQSGFNELPIELEEPTEGMYLVTVTIGEQVQTTKLWIK